MVASTMTATTRAAPMPMSVTTGIPEMARPRMAMTTVPPAKITAWPAVAVARAADSTTVMPSWRCSRCRVTTKRA